MLVDIFKIFTEDDLKKYLREKYLCFIILMPLIPMWLK